MADVVCVQWREPFVLVRAHVSASLVHASGEFIVDCWSSCADGGLWTQRRVDYIQLLVSYAQKSDHLTTFLSSQLDVPVCHAFFVHGAAGQLSLRQLRRLDGRHWLESITVSHLVQCVICHVDAMQGRSQKFVLGRYKSFWGGIKL